MSKKKKKEMIFPRLGKDCCLIDTHCHLDMKHYREDFLEMLARAEQYGVSRFITVGIDLESSREAVRLAAEYPGIYATVGVHPHNVGSLAETDYEELAALAANPKVVAYGEIGIDLYYDYAPLDVQAAHFARQVVLAKELGLPVVIHDRDAHAEVMAVLTAAAPFPDGGVMHCFSGDSELALQAIALGFYISVTGVVTFPKAELLQDVVRNVPLDRLLLETDSPFLTPEPRRGRRNEPALLMFTAEKVAALKELSLDEVARATTRNSEKLFRLSRPEQAGVNSSESKV